MCSWRLRFFFSQNKLNHCLFPFSCLGSWNGTNAAWHPEPLYGRAPSALCCITWKSPHQKRDEKIFLLFKSYYFADSQSLSCKVDSWVFKSVIFPSSLYITNLNLYFGLNAATKEGISVCLFFSSLPSPPRPLFHSSHVLCPGIWRVLHLGRRWLELLWKLISSYTD